MTLGEALKLCTLVFGKDSKATKFLEDKVAKEGADEPVIQAESQVIHMLMTLHNS